MDPESFGRKIKIVKEKKNPFVKKARQESEQTTHVNKFGVPQFLTFAQKDIEENEEATFSYLPSLSNLNEAMKSKDTHEFNSEPSKKRKQTELEEKEKGKETNKRPANEEEKQFEYLNTKSEFFQALSIKKGDNIGTSNGSEEWDFSFDDIENKGVCVESQILDTGSDHSLKQTISLTSSSDFNWIKNITQGNIVSTRESSLCTKDFLYYIYPSEKAKELINFIRNQEKGSVFEESLQKEWQESFESVLSCFDNKLISKFYLVYDEFMIVFSNENGDVRANFNRSSKKIRSLLNFEGIKYESKDQINSEADYCLSTNLLVSSDNFTKLCQFLKKDSEMKSKLGLIISKEPFIFSSVQMFRLTELKQVRRLKKKTNEIESVLLASIQGYFFPESFAKIIQECTIHNKDFRCITKTKDCTQLGKTIKKIEYSSQGFIIEYGGENKI